MNSFISKTQIYLVLEHVNKLLSVMVENVPRKGPGEAVEQESVILFSFSKSYDLSPVEKHSDELILVLTMPHDLNEAVVESKKNQ